MKVEGILFVALSLFTSCGNVSGDIHVNRYYTDARRVNVGDTVWARYRIRNVGHDTITLNLLPECDCMVVKPENMVLSPGQKVIAKVGFAPDAYGEFRKYVFIEQAENGNFLTLELIGESSEKLLPLHFKKNTNVRIQE